MIRATQLSGRPVVDLDVAEKLGTIQKIVIDPDARKVVALLVSRGGPLTGDRSQMTVPASSMHAIGPDAVTVRGGAADPEVEAHLDDLPRVSDVIGRKVVSQEGRLLGAIGDVLISGPDGRIIGYELADSNVGAKLKELFVEAKPRERKYLRADANLRAGRDLIVAPDDAVCGFRDEEAVAPAEMPRSAAGFPDPTAGMRTIAPTTDVAAPGHTR